MTTANDDAAARKGGGGGLLSGGHPDFELVPAAYEFYLDLGICKSYRREPWEAEDVRAGHVFAQVRLNYHAAGSKPAGVPELSISFDYTPMGRMRYGHRGQLKGLEFEPGSRGDDVVFVGRAYNLNALHAGCEHQRAAGWEREFTEAGRLGKVLAHLGQPCPVCGFEFGSSWQLVELPQAVIDLVLSWQADAVSDPDVQHEDPGQQQEGQQQRPD